MNILREFFTDPVLFFSFTGLAILIAMGIFYTWFFIKKAADAEEALAAASSNTQRQHENRSNGR